MPTTDAVEAAPPLLLGDRPTWKVVLELGWPVLVQQLLAWVVMLSDTLLAGRFPPHAGGQGQVASQAAQTTATYLMWLLTSYTVLVSVGSTALVARFIGADDRAGAVHVTNQALLLAAFLGLAGGVVGLVWVQDLVALLQLRGEVAAFAVEYLRPLFALLVFQMIESAGVACLVGAGDTRTGLWVLGGVAIINLPLAWGFHRGIGPIPGMGFPGIALGTAVSHLLGGVAVLIVLARGRMGLRLDMKLLWPDWGLLRRLLRISVPAGIDSLTVAVGQLWFLSVVNRLNAATNGAAPAAHGIALRWEALSFLTGTAFGTAAMTLVGQNLGAGKPERAAQSAWTAFGLGCLSMCFFGAVFYTLAPQMFQLFCPSPSQRPIIEAGVPVLRLVACAMAPLAASIVFTAALRGAGDTRVPVLFTLTGFFLIRIPLAYFLTSREVDLGVLGVWRGADLGLKGAWLAMCVDVFVRGGLILLRFAGGRWRRIEV
jgi:putative MATE family efflux protein